jgi:hypothetical protein
VPHPSRKQSWFLLIGGILLCQVVLFWPSLTGQKILAPTDILFEHGAIGSDLKEGFSGASNKLLLDVVQQTYPYLDFAAHEIRAGRLPLWNPYSYCGSPFLANPQSSIFSPFSALYYLWPSPIILVWIQPLQALIGGIGAFLFFRRIVESKWAALIGGCCFPLIGFNWLWLTFWPGPVVVWLPWGLLASDAIIRKPSGWGGPGLALIIALLIHAQHLQTAALCLAAIGSYAIWRWIRGHFPEFRTSDADQARWRAPVCVGLAAALLGLAMGSVKILPAREYLHSSMRMEDRKAGLRDDPIEVSKTAPELGRLFFPYLFGSRQKDSHELSTTEIVINEGGAQGYSGCVMLALLAPIGLVRHRRNPDAWFWVVLGICGAAPMFRIPVFNLWAHIPPFDLSRNGRALVITAWAALVLGVKGLDALSSNSMSTASRLTGWIAAALAALSSIAFVSAIAIKPNDLLELTTQQAWPWFRNYFVLSALITGISFVLLLALLTLKTRGSIIAILFGVLALSELVVTARGYNPQVSRETFYPQREFVRYLQEHVGDGRIVGFAEILYPNVSMMYGLRDIRGYDAVDPLPYVQLLRTVNLTSSPYYAVNSYFISGPSPVLDLLSVRYVATTQPNSTPWWEEVFRANGVWIYRNPTALRRAFVPRTTRVVTSETERLQLLANPLFNPRESALLGSNLRRPINPAAGIADIIEEIPTRVVIHSQTDGNAIVVLTDAWSPGWEVAVDGKTAEAFPVDNVLRGVEVPTGEHTIEWNYSPRSVRIGKLISTASLALLIFWLLYCRSSGNGQSREKCLRRTLGLS